MLRFILGCACGAVFALIVVIAVAALAALMPAEAVVVQRDMDSPLRV
jgi:hypothetical protein